MGYQIWNKVDTLVPPTGESETAQEFLAKYPAFNNADAKLVISTGVTNKAFSAEFGMFKDHYRNLGADITDDMTPEEVCAAVTRWEENRDEVQRREIKLSEATHLETLAIEESLGHKLPDTQEQIASALAFMALSAMPTE